MGRHLIKLFMWGYQPHFRIMLKNRAKDVFKLLGVDVEPQVLLVGALSPNKKNPNPVCVEPEDDEWPLDLFDNLHTSIAEISRCHEHQQIFYTDEQSMLEKPERIHCDSVRKAVKQSLEPFDVKHDLYSFCGNACLVNDYYVVPVIQVPQWLFDKFPPLKQITKTNQPTWQGPVSFIHACMIELLKEAVNELKQTEPGKSLCDGVKRADEIVRDGATNFMLTPGAAVTSRYVYTDLFERFNLISSLMYEGLEGSGYLILANPENPSIDYLLNFEEPVPFRESRWVR